MNINDTLADSQKLQPHQFTSKHKSHERLVVKGGVSSFFRMKAQTLVDSLSELMVDATLGTIQCLEEIVSKCFISIISI